MKVLFLDIDGVLNSHDWWRRREPLGLQGKALRDLDPEAVALLNGVIARTGAKVVISSTWRLFGVEFVEEALTRRGFVGEIIGATDVFSDDMPNRRGREIFSWLNTHAKPESVAIVDDDSDMGPLLPRLVKTTHQRGIEREHVEQLVVLLNEATADLGTVAR